MSFFHFFIFSFLYLSLRVVEVAVALAFAFAFVAFAVFLPFVARKWRFFFLSLGGMAEKSYLCTVIRLDTWLWHHKARLSLQMQRF